MKTVAAAVGVVTVMVWWSVAQEPSEPRRDGRWEVTMTTNLPDVAQQPPPLKLTQCVTKDDAKDPGKVVPLSGGDDRGMTADGGARVPHHGCRNVQQSAIGAKVSWTTDCGEKSAMKGVGEFVYGADTYVGTMTVTLARAGAPFTMTMTYVGERVGDCDISAPMTPVRSDKRRDVGVP